MLKRYTDNKILVSITKLSDYPDNAHIFTRSNKKRGLGKRSAIENDLSAVTNKRLEAFVGYFVKEFEARLIAYCMIAEEEIKKTEEVWQALSATTTCGFEKLFLLNEKDDVNKPQNILYASNLNIHAKDRIVTFRQRLVEAGVDIFQSFEMQFMRVTVGQGDKGPTRAMHKLARDAVDRVMNYIKEHGGILIENGNILIAESILFGQSKEKVIGTEASHVSERVRAPGFKINYTYQSNQIVWETASLFEKTGLVRESTHSLFPHTYDKSKNNQSDTSKYGYRRLFALENLYNLGKGYEEDSVEGNKTQFTNYTYLISPEKLKETSITILDDLNREYKKLSDTRIKAIFEEAKQTILKEISDLKGQCSGHVAYCNKLENIRANLNNLNVDSYLNKFDSYFKEMQKNQIDALKKALLMKGSEGSTPLHAATFGMEGQQSVKELLWQVKDQSDFLQELLRVQDDKGRTPLHMAAWWGRQQAVNELLEHIKTQSDFLQELLLIQNEHGGTPLHVAAANNRGSIIGSLLEGVKDQPDFLKKLFLLKDKQGRTPLRVAVTARVESVKEVLKYVEDQPDFLQELLQVQDNEGKTPLHVAAQYGSKVIVEMLLENGANPNTVDNEGKTPLALAEQRDYVEVANLLKKQEEGAVTVIPTPSSNFNLSQEAHKNSSAQISTQKARRSERAAVQHDLENNEQILLSQKESISVASKGHLMDQCTLGVRDGQSYVEGITCATKNGEMKIFLKDSDVKLESPEDTYFRQSCRPVEFNGYPSVYCEGQKTNIVYTAIPYHDLFERFNEQFMLFHVVMHEGKKLYHWLKNLSKEKNNSVLSSNKAQIDRITTRQKVAWEKLLVNIEERLTDLKELAKGKDASPWAWHILEDRKQEFEDLLQQSETSLEQVNAFTENLQALQAELEVMENVAFISSSVNKASSLRKMQDVDTAKPNPLNSVAVLSAQKVMADYSSKPRFAIGSERGFFKAQQQPVSTFISAMPATNTSIGISKR